MACGAAWPAPPARRRRAAAPRRQARRCGWPSIPSQEALPSNSVRFLARNLARKLAAFGSAFRARRWQEGAFHQDIEQSREPLLAYGWRLGFVEPKERLPSRARAHLLKGFARFRAILQ